MRPLVGVRAALLLTLVIATVGASEAESQDVSVAKAARGGRRAERAQRKRERKRENRQERLNRQAERRRGHHVAKWNQTSDIDLQWVMNNLTALWDAVNELQGHHIDTSQLEHYGEGLIDLRISADLFPATGDRCPTPYGFTTEECSAMQSQCHNAHGANSTAMCNGNGECCCGECLCRQPYTGRYCECSDELQCSSTSEHGSCSGNGDCVCGTCACHAGWEGEGCDCHTGLDTCVNGDTGAVCSGSGDCVCGTCHCQNGYFGAMCSDTLFEAGVCERLKPCVLCSALGKQLHQCITCGDVVASVKKVPELQSSVQLCRMVHSGCLLQYSYHLEGDRYSVLVSDDAC